MAVACQFRYPIPDCINHTARTAKGKLVSGITLNLDTEQINENLHGVLNDIMKSSTDNRTPLYLRIHDHELNRSIRLSTAVKMPVTRHSSLHLKKWL